MNRRRVAPLQRLPFAAAIQLDRAEVHVLTTRRRGEVVIGLPAKLLRLMHDVFPAITLRTLDISNRLLPCAKPV